VIIDPEKLDAETFSENLRALQVEIEECRLLQSACGFIIIDDHNDPPYYWNGTSFRHRCEDSADMESPLVFSSRPSAQTKAQIMNEQWAEDKRSSCALEGRAIVVLWIHPEASYKPLPGYMTSRNVQYPGSVK
jgi:hypothetical protein